MRVLIIENELYLAQSIAMRLSDLGYSCEIFNSYDELIGQKNYEIVLISSNTPNFLKAVEKFKNTSSFCLFLTLAQIPFPHL